MTPVVELDGGSLTLEALWEVAHGRGSLALAPSAIARMDSSRRCIEAAIARHSVLYGVTTGFGKLSTVTIPVDEIERLQYNLLLSHATGTGDPLPAATVRAILALKANALAKGLSGCRREVAQTLIDMANRGVLPVIPEKGSVGASGDLAPLAHMALVLIGEGEAFYEGRRLPGGAAMAEAGIAPLRLAAKEGLALINGTQVMTAILALATVEFEQLLKVADIAAAISVEAMLGTATAFDERIHRARGLAGQMTSAGNIRRLLQGSPIVASHRQCHKVQDQYSLRCVPQVHGAAREAAGFVRDIVSTELNAATDNPLVFAEDEAVLSGGNFHGQPIALAADTLAIAAAQLANIAERRTHDLLDPAASGLPAFLAAQPGLNSGLMIAQVTAASLVSENKVLAHPASVDSIPTSANQENFVSMGTWAARKAAEVVGNCRHVLAIELLCGCQALDLRQPLQPGPGTGAVHAVLRQHVPTLREDRLLHRDIETVKALIADGSLVAAAEAAVGPL
ncbi:MAG: histidine ammonia-lyase [bacterium]|jgi:histidine ammonia-lyase|nr:histidine ammonia-lyase [candidate division KSB1 bacterium]MDH7561459.1 histidine ammonia-lyase [bacterium]